MKRILFITGSIGLGHVGRDLEIASALRKTLPDIDISWMAESPATEVLEKAGEKLLPEASSLSSASAELEGLANDYQANLVKWVMNMRKGWAKNAEVYARIVEKYNFDLWIGDEPYDIMIAMLANPGLKKCPFVVIYDFLGLDATTRNPVDHIAAYLTNRLWLRFLDRNPPLADKSLFIGELEDVADRKFGFMLPNRRALAKRLISFVGYVLPDDIEKFRDKAEARKLLGYGNEPLIICSIGGTSAGKKLLDLCVQAYPKLKDRIPDLQMILVCGPRVAPDTIQAPPGVKVVGYLPELYKHLGAADLCVVTGGGTITLELTALQRPFLYFPLEHHFEQEVDVANRCQRHRAGIRMSWSKTTPESLTDAIVSNMGKPVDYASVPVNGAQEAVRTIRSIL